MKPERNKKYTTIAIYTAGVLMIGIVFAFLLWNFDSITGFFSNLLDICSPIMYGALIAYILNPMMKLFEDKLFKKKSENGLSRTAKRTIAVVLTFLAFLTLLGLFVWMLLPQLVESIKDLGDKFPSYLQSIEDLAHSIAASGGFIAEAIETLLTNINEFIDSSYDLLQQYFPKITEMLQSVAAGALDIVLGIVFSIYFLMAKEHIAAQTKKFIRAVVSEKNYNNILRIVTLTDNTFGKYFTGAILDSMLVGVICFLMMAILGMPYAPLISVIVAITNVIPYFGPVIGAIPSAIILFVANPIYAIYFAIMILVLQQIDGNIIAPRIHSASTGLAQVWVIVSITLMSGLFGFVGMFIGVPLFSVIYTLIKEKIEQRLTKKALPTETVEYMSELGKAYNHKPEKPPKKPWKQRISDLLEKPLKKKKRGEGHPPHPVKKAKPPKTKQPSTENGNVEKKSDDS